MMSRRPKRSSSSRRTALAVVLVVAGCSSDDAADEPATTTVADSAETTVASSTSVRPVATVAEPPATAEPTTTVAPTTTLDPALPEAIRDLGYPASDDYVVETVVADVGAGTGGLAIDADGYFFHGDFGGFEDGPGNRVLRISPDGAEVEVLVESELMGQNVSTVFGPDGTLYQTAFGPDRLFAISPDDGTFVEVTTEDLVGPTGIVPRDDGSLIVQSFSLRKLWHVAPDGTLSNFTRSPAPGFDGPNGLSVGPDGTIYSVNFGDGGLFEVDADGEVARLFTFPMENAHVAYLDGGLFVTSRTGYVVWRYDLATGEVVVVAGNGSPGDADGRGVESSFGSPNAITVGPDGHLYINHGDGAASNPTTIRRIRFDPS
jgi:outer membrane protein assembly factor BamB